MELYPIKTEHPIVGFCESRIGGRSENQDSYGYHDTPFGLLVVVCDGMGGGPAGKTASSLAVSEILSGVMESDKDNVAKEVLLQAIQRANQAILNAVEDKPELKGMGTTCTAVLINKVSTLVAHVGDSRVYQLRHHKKVFRTFDHSLVFDLVKQKVITEEQARLSDQSNIITRALGMKPELEIDIEERPYKKGDRFLLCTDGIHGTMPEKELIALATQRCELGKVVDGIAAMVDENGRKNESGHDNLTLILIEAKEKSKLKERMKNKTTLILGLIAAALAIVCLLLNSCQNDNIDVDTFSIEREDVRPGVDTVRIEGTYDFFKDAESMKINIGCDSTLSDAQSHAVALTGKGYAVTVRNLQPSTTYYYRYSVNIGLPRDFLTPTKHFTTLALPPTQHYTVSTNAQPVEGGTVTGGGTYESGQQCMLTATPNEGYDFVNWMENDSILSTDSLYILLVYRDHNLTANFEMQTPPIPDEYTISVSANPTEGGTVSGGGTFQEGQSCTVRATANTGYTFVNWTENGNQVSSDANYTFTVNSDRSLVANFTAASYIISATVTPEGSGTITGAGGYENGQSCTLRATANTGYAFEKWTENGTQVSTNAAYTFTVTSSHNLVAHFKVLDYTINVSAQPSNGGTVAGGGTYQYGQSCTVTATASSGYTFSCWKENSNVVSTDASYTFNVSGNRNLVASFVAELPTMYTIAVSANPSEGGTVTGGGTFQQGYSCTVNATANSGYTFSNWTENGNVVSSNTSYSFIVTGNRTLVAHFTANPQSYSITVTANPTNGGTVNGGGTYQQGQSCTVTAEPNRSSAFYYNFDDSQIPAGWTTIDNGNPVGYGWQIGSAKLGSTGNGHNGLVDFVLSESYDNSYGVIYPDNYLISERVSITNGSTFSFWACAQDASCPAEHFGVAVSTISNSNPNDFQMIQEWTLTAKGGNGSVIGRDNRATLQGTWYEYSVDLSAYAGQQVYIAIRHFNCSDMFYLDVDDVELTGNSGFSFVNWTENGNVVSTDASYTFIVNGNRNLVANFMQRSSRDYEIERNTLEGKKKKKLQNNQ